jgi:uncharacterized lipoprotein YajG
MKSNHLFFGVLLIVLLLGLGGCATPSTPLSFSVPNVGLSSKKIDAEVKSITVTFGRPDELTGEVRVPPIMIQQVAEQWRVALQEALDKMLVFRDDAEKKVTLAVKILKFDLPRAGFSMRTGTAAKYEITDRSNGAIIYSSTVDAEGICPADYAFAGRARMIESANRAVQNNILQFLQALESVDVTKPMFPSANK